MFQYLFYRPHSGAYKLLNSIFVNCDLGSRLKKIYEEIFFSAGSYEQECPLCSLRTMSREVLVFIIFPQGLQLSLWASCV